MSHADRFWAAPTKCQTAARSASPDRASAALKVGQTSEAEAPEPGPSCQASRELSRCPSADDDDNNVVPKLTKLEIAILARNCSGRQFDVVLEHSLEPFSEHRTGMLGDYYSLKIKIPEPSPLTCQFFVKTPPSSSSLHGLAETRVYECEQFFFGQLYPGMISDFDDPWCPECYYNRPGLLVLEDLRSKGYAIRPRPDFDLGSIKLVLGALARFHIASSFLEAKLDVPLSHIDPKRYFTDDKVFNQSEESGRYGQLCFHTMGLLAKRFGLEYDLLPAIFDHICQLVKARPGLWNTLCHGDLSRGNLMFPDYVTSEPGAGECLLVDFQMLRYASPLIDVAQLIYTRTTPEFRRLNEKYLLDYYYMQLELSADRYYSDCGIKMPCKKSVLRDYNIHKIVGLAYSAMRWPPAVVRMRELGDVEALDRWYRHSQIEVYDRLFEEDPGFAEKTKQRIGELIDVAQRRRF